MNGGDRIAEVLAAQGVEHLFTLCGGHISPILVGAKARGIRVIDVRDEATAVFAADATARLTGIPGVAAVTAGPGLTNTITAVKNAQLAQSPVVLLGGAAATVLRGRGSLQDIDQAALMKPHVKAVLRAKRVRDLAPMTAQAFATARDGVPGPVFVECPIDLLYEESLVREWYGAKSAGKTLMERAEKAYLRLHLKRMFAGLDDIRSVAHVEEHPIDAASASDVSRALAMLERAERPVLVVGSQTVLESPAVAHVAKALADLGAPVFLSGMARGLLGAKHRLLFRHKRRDALREADLVLLAGVPCDFRLDYGRHIRRATPVIAVNRSSADLKKNRRPALGVLADPGRFLRALAALTKTGERWAPWHEALAARDAAREREIDASAAAPAQGGVNPVALCREIEKAMAPESVIVADGGDFVGTASYTLNPRAPLSWLDPGVFGTLGVGAGFALGASLVRSAAEIWIIFGDGSLGYSLTEFDSFVRHGLAPIAVVGNDGSWAQIARDQIEILKDDVATVLRRSDYERAAEGLGARGLRIDDIANAPAVFAEAKRLSKAGHPVLINALLARSDFRKGSISM